MIDRSALTVGHDRLSNGLRFNDFGRADGCARRFSLTSFLGRKLSWSAGQRVQIDMLHRTQMLQIGRVDGGATDRGRSVAEHGTGVRLCVQMTRHRQWVDSGRSWFQISTGNDRFQRAAGRIGRRSGAGHRWYRSHWSWHRSHWWCETWRRHWNGSCCRSGRGSSRGGQSVRQRSRWQGERGAGMRRGEPNAEQRTHVVQTHFLDVRLPKSLFFGSSILKPDLHLRFGQFELLREVGSFGDAQILFHLELVLERQKLLCRERSARLAVRLVFAQLTLDRRKSLKVARL